MTARGTTQSSLGWAFGICLSVLFVSLWGRAVVVDTETLGESLAPLGRSEVVVDYVTDWMGDELVASGVPTDVVDPAIDRFMESSAVTSAVDGLVAEVVVAAASPDPAGSNVDVRSHLAPAVPEVAQGLEDLGYGFTRSQVQGVVEDLDPIVIRQPGQSALVGPNSPTAARLGIASLIATIGLTVFGSVYIRLSEDRVTALRRLLNRVAVSGLSFAVLLRLGAWVVDPAGGRAPVPETLANLAASKWLTPLQVGLVAAVVAAVVYVVRRSVTPGGGSPSPSEQPTPTPAPQQSRPA
ncbi:MAG TPA: hypothetical protein VFS66_04500 [Acidimicrobiia bacterium]|nr:hypothetical protein [Acidimicrobiia bacterium]